MLHDFDSDPSKITSTYDFVNSSECVGSKFFAPTRKSLGSKARLRLLLLALVPVSCLPIVPSQSEPLHHLGENG